MKFGKKPKKTDRLRRTLQFHDFLTAPPRAPVAYDSLPRALAKFPGLPLGQVFPMDGNSDYGDCTIAARQHANTLFGAMVGHLSIARESDTVAQYLKLGNGQDDGLAELDVLTDWAKGTVPDQIAAFVEINPKNIANVKLACWMFGAVYLGFTVQQAASDDFDARRTWTPGPLTDDGHAVLMTGYTPTSMRMLTWGSDQEGSWDWWTECVDEAYAVLAPEASQPGFCAAGFDCDALKQQLAIVRA